MFKEKVPHRLFFLGNRFVFSILNKMNSTEISEKSKENDSRSATLLKNLCSNSFFISNQPLFSGQHYIIEQEVHLFK